MKLKELKNISDSFPNSETMPMLFVGHGNPMNAIEDNKFSRLWKEIGLILPQPTAILSVSAHWLTSGTKVTAMENPKTIHDFGGFPDELYRQKYSAPGSPSFALQTQQLSKKHHILLDYDWGFDHGTWSVLKNMFPDANIPVFQLSIDYSKPNQYHFELAQELQLLRNNGVLIIGSGNIVHNLQAITYNENKPFDWAIEFDQKITDWIQSGNRGSIVEFQDLGRLAKMAHPTIEHFLPLLYVLGLQNYKDKPTFFNDSFDMSSISMRSVLFQNS